MSYVGFIFRMARLNITAIKDSQYKTWSAELWLLP